MQAGKNTELQSYWQLLRDIYCVQYTAKKVRQRMLSGPPAYTVRCEIVGKEFLNIHFQALKSIRMSFLPNNRYD